jgi:hypothetical protein
MLSINVFKRHVPEVNVEQAYLADMKEQACY